MFAFTFLIVALFSPAAMQASGDVEPPIALAQMEIPQRATGNFDAARCRGIAELTTQTPPMFIQKENGEWECSYMLEYPETGHSPSVFVQIRGIEPGVWSSFRLKLNVGSLLSRQVLGNRAANLVYELIGDQMPMRELGAVLAAGQEFELSFDGVKLTYRQERFDKMRYNLSGTNAPGGTATSASPD